MSALLKSAMLQSTLVQNTLLRNTLERWALNRAPMRFATEQAIHEAVLDWYYGARNETSRCTFLARKNIAPRRCSQEICILWRTDRREEKVYVYV